MKIDRMFGILAVLLNHEKVKARDLAERFEVSLRTIYRDIEAINKAGIPIVTYPGFGGGVGIVPEFKLDKSLLSSDEMKNIMAGLKGLQTISDDAKIKTLIAKLDPGGNQFIPLEHDIIIDLSSWNENSNISEKIRLFRKAIFNHQYAVLNYYSNAGYSERRIEPYRLLFKESNWYIYAYCTMRNNFRLFKLNRIVQYRIENEHYVTRPLPQIPTKWEGDFNDDIKNEIVLAFNSSLRYLVIDAFGVDGFVESDDGKLIARFKSANQSFTYNFILGFGNQVEVLSPASLRESIKAQAQKIVEVYES